MCIRDRFSVSHQEPSRICFTKKESQNNEGTLIKYDQVKLDVDFDRKTKFDILVYIHHKGQLLGQLSKPKFQVFSKPLSKLKGNKGLNYIVKFRINTLGVLRNRPNAVKECDDALLNEDQQWRLGVVREMGCIPAFMKRFLFYETSFIEKYSDKLSINCNQTQYGLFKKSYTPFGYFNTVSKLYKMPCTQLNNIVTTTKSYILIEDINITTLAFKFVYPTNYRETINKQVIVFTEVWSRIGGFVGILIGYSIMQIPEMFENLLKWVKHLSYKRNKIMDSEEHPSSGK